MVAIQKSFWVFWDILWSVLLTKVKTLPLKFLSTPLRQFAPVTLPTHQIQKKSHTVLQVLLKSVVLIDNPQNTCKQQPQAWIHSLTLTHTLLWQGVICRQLPNCFILNWDQWRQMMYQSDFIVLSKLLLNEFYWWTRRERGLLRRTADHTDLL